MSSIDDQFFYMVNDMLNKGLRPHSYKLRGRALANIFDLKKSTNFLDEEYIIQCTTSAGWLAQRLFINSPSFSEISQCETCDYTNEKNLTSVQIEDVDMKS